MGFNKVYQCLLDIFPQVDQRILKAVAIENSKDVDAAAETILSEILPYLSKKPTTSSLQEQTPIVQLDDEVTNEEESSQLKVRQSGKDACSSSVSMFEGHENVPNTGLRSGNNESGDTDSEELILLGKSPEKSAESGTSKIIQVKFDAMDVNEDSENANQSQACANLEPQELGSFDKNQIINNTGSTGQSPLYISVSSSDESVLILGSGDAKGCLNNSQGLDRSVDLAVESVVTQMISSAQENSPDSPKGDLHVVVSGNSSSHPTDSENQEGDDLMDLQSQDPINEMCDGRNDSDLDVVHAQSDQICRIDILEEIIEDAKNNKKTLFQAMQSVMDFMREVELEEEAAEQAKEEAARGGLDILGKVEELKEMLAHGKEANDMHAGEIYGEKAILATEVRELQSRLFSLLEERDQSLAILDEMRQTLEARRAAAEEIRKEAELEKLEKEKSARNAFAQQEFIMEKVVQESKILQQEAEENFKLQEFLMDRGRIVDSLQGEISVICEDVRLLKQKFDERVPLSKSISSSQTSCILASSGSSVKSVTSEPGKISPSPSVDGQSPKGIKSVTSEPEKISPAPSVNGQSPKGRLEEDRFGADRKELLEDGWDLFEKDAEFYS